MSQENAELARRGFEAWGLYVWVSSAAQRPLPRPAQRTLARHQHACMFLFRARDMSPLVPTHVHASHVYALCRAICVG
jgi:hypothetical protein